MPKTKLYISGVDKNEVLIEPQEIYGQRGLGYFSLLFPLEFRLFPIELYPSTEKKKPYTLLWFKGELFLENLKISETISKPLNLYVNLERTEKIYLELPLDLCKIKKIEEKRKDNVKFRLRADILIAEHPEEFKYPEQKTYTVDRFSTGFFELNFEIPQSHWCKILSELGYNEFFIIEVPKGKGEIKKAWEYIEKAKQAFVTWNIGEVFNNCRNAGKLLDGIINEKYKNQPIIKKWKRAYSKFEYLASLALHPEDIKKKNLKVKLVLENQKQNIYLFPLSF